MEPMVKTYLVNEADGQPFWGYGPVMLLKKTAETGSLRSAAREMGMAYTKALRLLRRAEEGFGCRLLERRAGGAGGGGSVLTETCVRYIAAYERYRQECIAASERYFRIYFASESTSHAGQQAAAQK